MGAISSMTGFARCGDSFDDHSWVWEIRSVNGRGLDFRFRWPSGFEHLDAPARKAVAKIVTRGNLQISLALQSTATDTASVNTELLASLVSQAQEHAVLDVTPGTIAQFMALPGVMSANGVTEPDTALDKKLLSSLDAALEKLRDARRAEGDALQPLLSGAVDRISELTEQATSCASAQPIAIKGRLQARMAELLLEGLDLDRLEAEAAILAGKADVREELDRLRAHVEQARVHLAQGSPVGRKLDFLAQEFNRETNTLCSKSADITLTQIGLEMKSAIEQFREQAANVE